MAETLLPRIRSHFLRITYKTRKKGTLVVQSKKKKTESKPKENLLELKSLCEEFADLEAMLSTSTVSHCKAHLKALIAKLEVCSEKLEGTC